MKSYEAIPLQSVGPVALGMSRCQVHAAMGAPALSFRRAQADEHPTDAWHNNAFQVSYSGAEELVEFIELSGRDLAVTCAGVQVFSTPAPAVVASIEQLASVDASDPEYGCSFVFPSLELAFWRPVTEGPEAIFFSTVGVGRRGYFSSAA